ncbi:MFS transporter [Clostridium celatum]|uniref:Transporter, major facilitator family protein n=1 Tax=Clostridium celatum DSM 1785 TaxID=545697 RepID=L1QBZ5_9CLOT|nr:MFS transporter [Clostridium celatum]EKY25132.1 transporter, major facilitator family protein [Clostridium celatum DSM 1785]MCE9655912.1 MFS transporter [Clostridium celatum]MDU6294841.1 MFS transporter [Clostridium celatum]MDY3360783.1 MFS transporter [Clostridium celatum]
MKIKEKSLFFIIFLTLFSSLTFNMAHPVTPMFINKLGLPTFMFGLFFATMSIGNFIGSPLFGSLSDKKGRLKFLILGAVGYGISQLGFGFNTNPFIILIFRFTGGFFVVSYLTTSMAYLTDVTTKENRTKYITYYAAANTIGGALGSLLGGVIGNNNFKIAFFSQFILCLILGALVFFLLEEPHREKSLNSKTIKYEKISYSKFLNKNLLIMFIVVIAFYFAATSYNSSINYYIEDVLNLSPTFIGGFLAFTGILGFTVNLIFTPLMAKYFKEINIFKVITICLSIALGLMVLSNNVILFLSCAVIFSSFASIHIPLQQSIITKLSNGNYGSLMGIFNSSKAVGQVTGSLLSGFIFDLGNKLPFLLSSVIICIAFIILLPTKPNVLTDNKEIKIS